MKRIKLASEVLFPPKGTEWNLVEGSDMVLLTTQDKFDTGLIDLIETNTNNINAEQYKDMCQIAAIKNNVGDTFTEFRYRFAEFMKLNNDGNKLSLGQSINNMHQCLFNIQNGINSSTIGLEALKKKA